MAYGLRRAALEGLMRLNGADESDIEHHRECLRVEELAKARAHGEELGRIEASDKAGLEVAVSVPRGSNLQAEASGGKLGETPVIKRDLLAACWPEGDRLEKAIGDTTSRGHEWVLPALAMKGRPGRGRPAFWYPAEIAYALMTKFEWKTTSVQGKRVDTIIREDFEGSIKAWERHVASLKEIEALGASKSLQ